MPEGLAKTDTRIDDNFLSWNSSCKTSLNPFLQMIIHIQCHIIVMWIELHGAGVALSMHKHNWATKLSNGFQAFWIIAQG